MNSNEFPINTTEADKADKNEKITSITRVLGRKHEDIDEVDRKEIFDILARRFKNQESFKKELEGQFGDRENMPDFMKIIYEERKKTPEELEIIKLANEETNILRKRFGLPDLNIPLENIYIIPREVPWPDRIDCDNFYAQLGQHIVIRDSESEQLRSSKLVFSEKLLHEMIHFKSYNSVKTLENYPAFGSYRIGLNTYTRADAADSYFNHLNDAVVEELTIQIMEKLMAQPAFKSEVEKTNELKNQFARSRSVEDDPIIRGEEFYITTGPNDLVVSASFAKDEERKILYRLIDKIHQKSPEKSKEEIFNTFVEAVMTGRIVNLGKMIDRSFGNGTFGNIAASGNDVNNLEKYVDNLK